MSKHAVIELAGRQYLVTEGETISINKHPEEEKTLEVKSVLLLVDEGKTIVGTPYVENSSVTLEIKEKGKDEKVIIKKFKAKSRYRLKKGHRQPKTTLLVTKIS